MAVDTSAGALAGEPPGSWTMIPHGFEIFVGIERLLLEEADPHTTFRPLLALERPADEIAALVAG